MPAIEEFANSVCREGPEAPSVIRPVASRINAFAVSRMLIFTLIFTLSAICCYPRMRGGSSKISLSFQVRHQIPLKGDVQLVIV